MPCRNEIVVAVEGHVSHLHPHVEGHLLPRSPHLKLDLGRIHPVKVVDVVAVRAALVKNLAVPAGPVRRRLEVLLRIVRRLVRMVRHETVEVTRANRLHRLKSDPRSHHLDLVTHHPALLVGELAMRRKRKRDRDHQRQYGQYRLRHGKRRFLSKACVSDRCISANCAPVSFRDPCRALQMHLRPNFVAY
jgi:hypothetical protein